MAINTKEISQKTQKQLKCAKKGQKHKLKYLHHAPIKSVGQNPFWIPESMSQNTDELDKLP